MFKRFMEFATQNTDNGEINNGFHDIKTGEWYYTKDSENAKKICELLNELHEENQRLKAQLTADIDGVCSLCNHHYLVKDEVMQGFYTSKCEKGHEKCSKEAVKYCDDFDLKEEKK